MSSVYWELEPAKEGASGRSLLVLLGLLLLFEELAESSMFKLKSAVGALLLASALLATGAYLLGEDPLVFPNRCSVPLYMVA